MAARPPQGMLRTGALPGSCFVSGLGAADDERVAAAALVHGLKALGLLVAAMTPMALDGVFRAGRWTSAHLEHLGREGSFGLPGPALSPYVLPPAATPALAAQQAGLHIKGQAVVETYQVLATWADVIVVEGVGGLEVPLGPSLAVHDLVRHLALPLVLAIRPDENALQRVAGAMQRAQVAGVRVAGWIATGVTDEAAQVLPPLTAALGQPAMAALPLHAASGQAAARHLDLATLRASLALGPGGSFQESARTAAPRT